MRNTVLLYKWGTWDESASLDVCTQSRYSSARQQCRLFSVLPQRYRFACRQKTVLIISHQVHRDMKFDLSFLWTNSQKAQIFMPCYGTFRSPWLVNPDSIIYNTFENNMRQKCDNLKASTFENRKKDELA